MELSGGTVSCEGAEDASVEVHSHPILEENLLLVLKFNQIIKVGGDTKNWPNEQHGSLGSQPSSTSRHMEFRDHV